MIVRDAELLKWAMGNVDPYNQKMINPASIDLRLGVRMRIPMWYWNPVARGIAHALGWKKWTRAFCFNEFKLMPGQFILCSSVEFTRIPNNCAAILFLKSSTGRRGIEHLHAGYGDPGFCGEWTWELTNTAPWPCILRVGEPLMQLVLVRLEKPSVNTYRGKYQYQAGPTEAR